VLVVPGKQNLPEVGMIFQTISIIGRELLDSIAPVEHGRLTGSSF
jgi:hypothetical protein